MHGIVRPAGPADVRQDRGVVAQIAGILHRFRFFAGLVLLPALLVAGYYYLICSDQYESSANFVVRKADTVPSGGGGLGQVLGFSVGQSQSQSEAFVIQEYLLSHEAVARLRREDSLVERFTRPGVDFLSRLWSDNPRPETLLKFYRKQVNIHQDQETGIADISVRAFTPEDAYAINSKLLRMGEQRINELNQRSFEDQVRQSRQDLAEAERSMAELQGQMTRLRLAQGDIDPMGTGKAQIGLVSNLTAALVEARSRLDAMGNLVSKSSPQYRALAAQVSSLQAQVSGQEGKLAGASDGSIASNLTSYEQLTVRREFAAQRFTAASAAYEQARAEARKKQLYLVRVVDASRPVKSLYPERGRIVLTVFVGLFLAYAIGRMIVAGVREHSL